MTRDEALLRAIEKDLPHYHRKRMAKLQGEQMAALAAEQAKASPDVKEIERLHKEMVRIERDKRDTSITAREVLEPLRAKIFGAAASAKLKLGEQEINLDRRSIKSLSE